ncbi:ATP-dependent DNA helicase PIF1-like protein [Tanacetum coccineum]
MRRVLRKDVGQGNKEWLGLELSDEQKMNHTLSAIEKLLQRNGTSLKHIPNMPYPVESQSINRLVEDELSYSVPKLNADHNKMLTCLTTEQRNTYDKIIKAVDKKSGGVFFLYGYGGTGKTFVWKTLSAAIRRRRDIVLNVASSRIAALLLPGGRTTHSRFAILINVNEDSTCFINIESDLARLIRKTKLIIWDEAPMVNKHCFEALDRTLKDIMRSSNPFGGIVVVFRGDFRQILPVILRGTRSEIVNASLRCSYIWDDIQVLKLTENMRLRVGNNNGESEETKAFADWILSIGNGEVGEDQEGEAEVEIPDGILIKDTSGDPIDAIINAIYPDVVANLSTPGYFEDRAILAPTNDVVNKINERMMKLIHTEERVYLSSDSISPCEVTTGVLVMLLRNIDQQAGLCNGTRLLVCRIGLHVVEAEIITGTNVGDITFIPRMRLNSSDKRMPLQFYRRQFPLAVCFGMTINKSQGQSLSQNLDIPSTPSNGGPTLQQFDIQLMQKEIDEELKAERLKNLMAWNWDAVIDLSKDVIIVIDDESNYEVVDYKKSVVINDTQDDTIDDNKQPAKRARKSDSVGSSPSEKDNNMPASEKTEEK